MNLKTTVIAAGLAAALGTGAAFAQSYSDSAPPQQAYGHHRGHHHGIRALIREEVQAGRISQQEGALLEQKIRELKAERRATRQGMQGNYGQGNYAPQSSQQPQPR